MRPASNLGLPLVLLVASCVGGPSPAPPTEVASAPPAEAPPQGAPSASASPEAPPEVASAAPGPPAPSSARIAPPTAPAATGSLLGAGNTQMFVEVSMGKGGTSKLSMKQSGSCEGDCALGPGTVLRLVAEQKPKALQRCFPAATQQDFTVRLGIDARGRVTEARTEGRDAKSKEAACVAAVLRASSFPPGSDPSSRTVLRFEVERSISP